MTIAQFRHVWKPWVTAAVEETVKRFPGTQNQGTYPGHDPSEARAADLMVPQDRRGLGYRISRWVWANRERLGVWYVIWWGEIRSTTRPNVNGTGWSGETGWQRYFDADNPNPSRSHHNHVHISFKANAPLALAPTAPTGKRPKTARYVVDPAKVSSYLFGLDAKGKVKHRRKAGFKINAVKIIAWRGKKWAVTAYGTRYALAYLKRA